MLRRLDEDAEDSDFDLLEAVTVSAKAGTLHQGWTGRYSDMAVFIDCGRCLSVSLE